MLLPVSYAKRTRDFELHMKVLAGDVGATKTNLGLFETNGQLRLLKSATYATKDFPDIIEMLKGFAKDEVVDRICLGVAGPVEEGNVNMTNAAHEIKARLISEAFHYLPVAVINDLEATAYGLETLQEHEFAVINKGQYKKGNMAIIAPGTGLGEAGLLYDGPSYHPFATEGGHSDFFPRENIDVELYLFLQEKYGHVSWERLLSGQGIYDIYRFLKEIKKIPETEDVTEQLKAADPAPVISQAAMKKESGLCVRTIELFFRYLAEESASLAIKLKATGGLFIGGGIIPKIYSMLNNEQFIFHFCEMGRLKSLLQNIPVKIILNEKTALRGAANFMVYRSQL